MTPNGLHATSVETEGTAFNAPTSTRPRAAEGLDKSVSSCASDPADDRTDLAEQLSRLNSDFEDSLDLQRQVERHTTDSGGPDAWICKGARGVATAGAILCTRPLMTVSMVFTAGLALGFGLRGAAMRLRGNRGPH